MKYLILAVVIVAAAILGFQILTFFFIFSILLFDKQYIRDLVEAEPFDKDELGEYINETEEAASWYRFDFSGSYVPDKGLWRNLVVRLWISSDTHTLAFIGSGTMLRIPYYRTSLYSRLQSGQRITTGDNFDEGDLLEIRGMRVFPGIDFDGLYTEHQARLKGHGDRLDAFDSARALETIEAMEKERVLRLVEKGFARFRDLRQNAWSYTFKGARDVYFSARLKQDQAPIEQQRSE